MPNVPASSAPGALAFYIGPVRVDPPIVLAPMAAVTNGPFRRLCKAIGGPGLLCTEQISVNALRYAGPRARRMLDWRPEEAPLSVQLFGSDPDVMAEAARTVVACGADIVDINMGCWVPKACRQGAGAALLKDADTAIAVVRSVCAAATVPVTVKMRAGWSADELTSVPLARQFEACGVSALTLHARTAQQGFEGSADWGWITDIARAVSIPVIGNGDVRTPDDAFRMLRATGCAGVMIGRAAIGNPWLLRDVASFLRSGTVPSPPSLDQRVATAVAHLEGLVAELGEDRAVRHLRAQLPHYVRGVRGASRVRELMFRAETVTDVRAVLSMSLD